MNHMAKGFDWQSQESEKEKVNKPGESTSNLEILVWA